MMAGDEYTDDINHDDVAFGLARILDGIDVLITKKRQQEKGLPVRKTG
jgi:hypothetical protein